MHVDDIRDGVGVQFSGTDVSASFRSNGLLNNSQHNLYLHRRLRRGLHRSIFRDSERFRRPEFDDTWDSPSKGNLNRQAAAQCCPAVYCWIL